MTRSNTLVSLAVMLAVAVIVAVLTVLLWDSSAGDRTQGSQELLVSGPRVGEGAGPALPPPLPIAKTRARPSGQEPERLLPVAPKFPRRGPLHFVIRVLDDETDQPVTAFSVDVLPHASGDALQRRDASTGLATRPFKVTSGVFRLPGKPGLWDLIVDAPGFEPGILTGLELPAARFAPLELRLSRGPGIAGRVFTLDGGAATNIPVHLHVSHLPSGVERPQIWAQHTDNYGRFHFSPLPAAVYSVSLHERGNMTDRYAGIRVEPGQTVKIEMVLAPRIDVVIEVRQPNGKLIPDAEIEVRSLDGNGRGLKIKHSGPGGRASFPFLLPGLYEARSRRKGYQENVAAFDVTAGVGLQYQTVVLRRALPAGDG